MAISVPDVGDVPVVWMPASDPDWGHGRAGRQPIAIVHHRIVGSLNSADTIFAANDTDPATVGSTSRSVSANFACGYDTDGKLYVHQYVDMSDTAYCNGDFEAGSNWEKWGYPTGFVTVDGSSMRPMNSMTISIEHDDQGGSSDPTKKGVVREDIIKLSIALDKLMLSGNWAAIKAAGIRCRDEATAVALGKIVPGPRTLIDHRDIAGGQKPYCWRPWQADTAGFPRQRYITELTPVVTPPTTMYTQAQVDAIVAASTAALTDQVAALQAQVSDLQTVVATDTAKDVLVVQKLDEAKSLLTS